MDTKQSGVAAGLALMDLPFLRAIEVQKKKEHAVKLANQLFDFDRTYSARAE